MFHSHHTGALTSTRRPASGTSMITFISAISITAGVLKSGSTILSNNKPQDTVPVTVDAIVYWTVWDVEKAALEVQQYAGAVSYVSLTGLRDVIGKHDLADLLQHRDQIAEGLQR